MIDLQNVLLFESHYRSRSWFLSLYRDTNLYIVSLLKEEKNFFINNGIENRKILDLNNLNLHEVELGLAYEYIHNFELLHNISLNQIIKMDRKIKNFNNEYIIKYCYTIIKNIRSFVELNKINFIIIEPTWIHEILAFYISKEYNVKYIAPVRDKLINNKFYFFKSFLRDEFYTKAGEQCRDFEHDLTSSKELPYFSYFSNRNKITFSKLIKLIDLIRLNYFGFLNKNMHEFLHVQLIRKSKDIIRNYLFGIIIDFHSIDQLKNNFILLTLHVQPEAGIDVVGSYYSNQLNTILQISYILPVGYCLVVKEHPHDFGRRNKSFYDTLKSIHNIKIISPYEKTSKILENKLLKLVVSIAGTSSLEAALDGVPAITLQKMYFHNLMIKDSFNPFIEDLNELLQNKYYDKKIFKERNINLYNKIYQYSFNGNCGDFKTDPYALSDENINYLKYAFLRIIND